MGYRTRHRLDQLGQNVWIIPGAFALGAAVLSYLTRTIDEILERRTAWYLFAGGPDGARTILSTVASSVMTFTGVVFSVTMLVLQLASSQFSPRVLRTFLQDLGTKLTLGVFVGTFIYALLGIRHIRGSDEDIDANVPGLTVWVAVILAIICVGVFTYFIHHVAQSIRAVNVLQRIGDETRVRLRQLFPDGIGNDVAEGRVERPSGAPSSLVPSDHESAVLMSVNEEQLWEIIIKADLQVALVPMVGDFVRQGSSVFEVWGDLGPEGAQALRGTLRFGSERSMTQDVAFGLRQLVDVAERALSPGINDPTTAVQALDQIHDILAQLALRRFSACSRRDEAGRLRLVIRRPTWADYVHLGIDEIRRAGVRSLQIHRRLRFIVEDLTSIAPTFRRHPITEQLANLQASADRLTELGPDLDASREPSAQGHGPRARGDQPLETDGSPCPSEGPARPQSV